MPSTWPFPKVNIPDFEPRVNFIVRQLTDPCDAPITVWVQFFWPALVHALLVWYTVDLVQILRTMFSPPTWGWRLKSVGHGHSAPRTGNKGLRSKLGKVIGFDPNAWAGKALSPFAEEEMYMMLPGEVYFYTAWELGVVALFYWSVIDVVSGFLYQWTSAVARSKYCQARDDAVLLASAPGYPLQGIFGWDAVGILNVNKMRNIDFFNGFGVSQSVGPGIVGMAYSATNIGGGSGPAWIESRMTCLNGPRAGSFGTRRDATGDLVSVTAGNTYDMAPGEIWIGELRTNGTWRIDGPELFCHAKFPEA